MQQTQEITINFDNLSAENIKYLKALKEQHLIADPSKILKTHSNKSKSNTSSELKDDRKYPVELENREKATISLEQSIHFFTDEEDNEYIFAAAGSLGQGSAGKVSNINPNYFFKAANSSEYQIKSINDDEQPLFPKALKTSRLSRSTREIDPAFFKSLAENELAMTKYYYTHTQIFAKKNNFMRVNVKENKRKISLLLDKTGSINLLDLLNSLNSLNNPEHSQLKYKNINLLNIVEQTMAIVDDMHKMGMVYRDFKLQNFCVDIHENNTVTVYPIDFEFAYLKNNSYDHIQQDIKSAACGDPAYTCQDDYNKYYGDKRQPFFNEKSDIFSNGLVIAEILSTGINGVRNSLGDGQYVDQAHITQVLKAFLNDKKSAAQDENFKAKKTLIYFMLERMLSTNQDERPTAEEVHKFFVNLNKFDPTSNNLHSDRHQLILAAQVSIAKFTEEQKVGELREKFIQLQFDLLDENTNDIQKIQSLGNDAATFWINCGPSICIDDFTTFEKIANPSLFQTNNLKHESLAISEEGFSDTSYINEAGYYGSSFNPVDAQPGSFGPPTFGGESYPIDSGWEGPSTTPPFSSFNLNGSSFTPSQEIPIGQAQIQIGNNLDSNNPSMSVDQNLPTGPFSANGYPFGNPSFFSQPTSTFPAPWQSEEIKSSQKFFSFDRDIIVSPVNLDEPFNKNLSGDPSSSTFPEETGELRELAKTFLRTFLGFEYLKVSIEFSLKNLEDITASVTKELNYLSSTFNTFNFKQLFLDYHQAVQQMQETSTTSNYTIDFNNISDEDIVVIQGLEDFTGGAGKLLKSQGPSKARPIVIGNFLFETPPMRRNSFYKVNEFQVDLKQTLFFVQNEGGQTCIFAVKPKANETANSTEREIMPTYIKVEQDGSATKCNINDDEQLKNIVVKKIYPNTYPLIPFCEFSLKVNNHIKNSNCYYRSIGQLPNNYLLGQANDAKFKKVYQVGAKFPANAVSLYYFLDSHKNLSDAQVFNLVKKILECVANIHAQDIIFANFSLNTLYVVEKEGDYEIFPSNWYFSLTKELTAVVVPREYEYACYTDLAKPNSQKTDIYAMGLVLAKIFSEIIRNNQCGGYTTEKEWKIFVQYCLFNDGAVSNYADDFFFKGRKFIIFAFIKKMMSNNADERPDAKEVIKFFKQLQQFAQQLDSALIKEAIDNDEDVIKRNIAIYFLQQMREGAYKASQLELCEKLEQSVELCEKLEQSALALLDLNKTINEIFSALPQSINEAFIAHYELALRNNLYPKKISDKSSAENALAVVDEKSSNSYTLDFDRLGQEDKPYLFALVNAALGENDGGIKILKSVGKIKFKAQRIDDIEVNLPSPAVKRCYPVLVELVTIDENKIKVSEKLRINIKLRQTLYVMKEQDENYEYIYVCAAPANSPESLENPNVLMTASTLPLLDEMVVFTRKKEKNTSDVLSSKNPTYTLKGEYEWKMILTEIENNKEKQQLVRTKIITSVANEDMVLSHLTSNKHKTAVYAANSTVVPNAMHVSRVIKAQEKPKFYQIKAHIPYVTLDEYLRKNSLDTNDSLALIIELLKVAAEVHQQKGVYANFTLNTVGVFVKEDNSIGILLTDWQYGFKQGARPSLSGDQYVPPEYASDGWGKTQPPSQIADRYALSIMIIKILVPSLRVWPLLGESSGILGKFLFAQDSKAKNDDFFSQQSLISLCLENLMFDFNENNYSLLEISRFFSSLKQFSSKLALASCDKNTDMNERKKIIQFLLQIFSEKSKNLEIISEVFSLLMAVLEINKPLAEILQENKKLDTIWKKQQERQAFVEELMKIPNDLFSLPYISFYSPLRSQLSLIQQLIATELHDELKGGKIIKSLGKTKKVYVEVLGVKVEVDWRQVTRTKSYLLEGTQYQLRQTLHYFCDDKENKYIFAVESSHERKPGQFALKLARDYLYQEASSEPSEYQVKSFSVSNYDEKADERFFIRKNILDLNSGLTSETIQHEITLANNYYRRAKAYDDNQFCFAIANYSSKEDNKCYTLTNLPEYNFAEIINHSISSGEDCTQDFFNFATLLVSIIADIHQPSTENDAMAYGSVTYSSFCYGHRTIAPNNFRFAAQKTNQTNFLAKQQDDIYALAVMLLGLFDPKLVSRINKEENKDNQSLIKLDKQVLLKSFLENSVFMPAYSTALPAIKMIFYVMLKVMLADNQSLRPNALEVKEFFATIKNYCNRDNLSDNNVGTDKIQIVLSAIHELLGYKTNVNIEDLIGPLNTHEVNEEYKNLVKLQFSLLKGGDRDIQEIIDESGLSSESINFIKTKLNGTEDAKVDEHSVMVSVEEKESENKIDEKSPEVVIQPALNVKRARSLSQSSIVRDEPAKRASEKLVEVLDMDMIEEAEELREIERQIKKLQAVLNTTRSTVATSSFEDEQAEALTNLFDGSLPITDTFVENKNENNEQTQIIDNDIKCLLAAMKQDDTNQNIQSLAYQVANINSKIDWQGESGGEIAKEEPVDVSLETQRQSMAALTKEIGESIVSVSETVKNAATNPLFLSEDKIKEENKLPEDNTYTTMLNNITAIKASNSISFSLNVVESPIDFSFMSDQKTAVDQSVKEVVESINELIDYRHENIPEELVVNQHKEEHIVNNKLLDEKMFNPEYTSGSFKTSDEEETATEEEMELLSSDTDDADDNWQEMAEQAEQQEIGNENKEIKSEEDLLNDITFIAEVEKNGGGDASGSFEISGEKKQIIDENSGKKLVATSTINEQDENDEEITEQQEIGDENKEIKSDIVSVEEKGSENKIDEKWPEVVIQPALNVKRARSSSQSSIVRAEPAKRASEKLVESLDLEMSGKAEKLRVDGGGAFFSNNTSTQPTNFRIDCTANDQLNVNDAQSTADTPGEKIKTPHYHLVKFMADLYRAIDQGGFPVQGFGGNKVEYYIKRKVRDNVNHKFIDRTYRESKKVPYHVYLICQEYSKFLNQERYTQLKNKYKYSEHIEIPQAPEETLKNILEILDKALTAPTTRMGNFSLFWRHDDIYEEYNKLRTDLNSILELLNPEVESAHALNLEVKSAADALTITRSAQQE